MISKGSMVTAITLLTASAPFAFATEPATQSADRTAVEAFTRKFLSAFENLDMKQFIACFANDATVFFPMPESPERVEGKQAIEQRVSNTSLLRSAIARNRDPHFSVSRPSSSRFN
jgi:hypothetical protein